MTKHYVLHYDKPAPDVNDGVFSWDDSNNPDDGWEKWALPIGNGFVGAKIFGRCMTERIQLTDNSFANPMHGGCCGAGLNNLAEISIRFGHGEVTDYERGLDIEKAIAYTRYSHCGCRFEREYFASCPDRVIAVRLSADRAAALSFELLVKTPFIRDYCIEPGDGMGKTGSVEICEGMLVMRSHLEYYDVYGEVVLAVESDGKKSVSNGSICVSGARTAVILIATGTNYELDSRVFTEKNPKKKLKTHDYPHRALVNNITTALKKGYDALKTAHVSDYQSLFNRTAVNLGGIDSGDATDLLIEQCRKGFDSRYLAELLYQYGRYLLISSSRPGGLPANLQGIWNCYGNSPWTSGYWHNINIQMNYWAAFSGGLSDLFAPYADYFAAYLEQAKSDADNYVKQLFSENASADGENGWSISTGAWPYEIQAINADTWNHSGPGTGAMTALLFRDYYDFTGDVELLKTTVYPALYQAALFLSKIMILKDGSWQIKYSASPEQWQDGKCYRTTGCTFDQQNCYEVFAAVIRAARILGREDDPLIGILRERLDLLEPFPIGKCGQIKEFREEDCYGEIGEYHHRHISQLVGVYPGTAFDRQNKTLKDAVEKTLCLRGDRSTGWAMAHRLCVWARTGNAQHTYGLLKEFINTCILPDLWDSHPPFQIDGNFGYCAAVGEMLLQSHRGYAELLPALPPEWHSGEFLGLGARGGFRYNCKWEDGVPVCVSVISLAGNELKLLLAGFRVNRIYCEGNKINFKVSDNVLSVPTTVGKEYKFILEG